MAKNRGTENGNEATCAETLARLMEAAPHAVMLVSVDGDVIYSNTTSNTLTKALCSKEDGRVDAKYRKRIREAIKAHKPVAEDIKIEGGRWNASIVPHDEKSALVVANITSTISNEKPLRPLNQMYRAVIDGILDHSVIMLDPKGNVLTWNRGAEIVNGYKAEEVIGKHFSIFYTEEDRKKGVPEKALKMAQESDLYRYETWHLRRDGTKFWGEVSLTPIHGDEGLIGFVKVTQDKSRERKMLDALKKAMRLWNLIHKANRIMFEAKDEEELLNRVCELLVTEGGYLLAWVGYAKHDRKKSVDVAASSGPMGDYLKGIEVRWSDTKLGRGPTGRAIRTGTTQIVRDIGTDKDYGPWRRDALAHGLRSSAAIPLKKRDGGVYGALNVYSPEVDDFDDEEIMLLEELAYDLSYGIMSHRTKAAKDAATEGLARSEERERMIMERLEAMYETMEQIVLFTDPEGRITYINPSGLRILSPNGGLNVLGKEARTVFRPHINFFDIKWLEDVLTKEEKAYIRTFVPINPEGGKMRNIEWTLALQYDKENKVIGMVAIGRDVYTRRRMEMAQDLLGAIGYAFAPTVRAVGGTAVAPVSRRFADIVEPRFRGVDKFSGSRGIEEFARGVVDIYNELSGEFYYDIKKGGKKAVIIGTRCFWTNETAQRSPFFCTLCRGLLSVLADRHLPASAAYLERSIGNGEGVCEFVIERV